MKFRYESVDANFSMKWKVLLVLSFGIFVYLGLGGLAFYYLEGQEEKAHKIFIQNFTDQFIDDNKCVTESELGVLLKTILTAYDRGIIEFGNSSSASNWDIASSVFFSVTVVTTIGYGHIYPVTVGGQAFCVVYAMFGIPFTLTLLAGIGHKLRHLFRLIDKKLDRCDDNPTAGKTFRVLLILTIGLLCFLFLPAVMFVMIDGWSYSEALYYCFITLTTIGFGDLVPGMKDKDDKNRSVYRIMVGVWIFVGLAWVAGVITFCQELLMNLLQKAQTNMDKKDIKSEENDEKSSSTHRDSYTKKSDPVISDEPAVSPPSYDVHEAETYVTNQTKIVDQAINDKPITSLPSVGETAYSANQTNGADQITKI